jgi:serine/threonine protein kinase
MCTLFWLRSIIDPNIGNAGALRTCPPSIPVFTSSKSNSTDVTTQFLAELRVYTTLTRHRNITAFLGCLEGLGLVLEYIDGHTLYDAIRTPPLPLTPARKIDYHNQLLSGLCHMHSFGLSHGDLSLLNIHISASSDTIKLLDFGRSVSASSMLIPPDAEPVDPFAHLHAALDANLAQTRGRNAFSRTGSGDHRTLPTVPEARPERKIEQIHPGTRPFSAPEILRGECGDPLLADAYSFGMIIVCLDREEMVDVKPWNQRKDLLPSGLFDKCVLFGERAEQYLRKYDSRRRLMEDDEMKV